MAADHYMMNVHAFDPPSNLIESVQKACARTGFDSDWTETKTENDIQSYWTTYEQRSIGLSFSPQSEREPHERVLNIGFQDHLYPSNWDDNSQYREFFDSCIELICCVGYICKAEYMGLFTASEYDTVIPTNLPLADHIDEIPRIGIYSESLLQDFGGLAGLFEEPRWEVPGSPWRVGELDDGSLLVITHATPWADGGWTDSSYVDLCPGEEYV